MDSQTKALELIRRACEAVITSDDTGYEDEIYNILHIYSLVTAETPTEYDVLELIDNEEFILS